MRVAPDTVAPVPAATESPCRESPLYAPLTPSDLAIDYRCGDLGTLGLARYDLVTAMEVIEHVADKRAPRIAAQ